MFDDLKSVWSWYNAQCSREHLHILPTVQFWLLRLQIMITLARLRECVSVISNFVWSSLQTIFPYLRVFPSIYHCSESICIELLFIRLSYPFLSSKEYIPKTFAWGLFPFCRASLSVPLDTVLFFFLFYRNPQVVWRQCKHKSKMCFRALCSTLLFLSSFSSFSFPREEGSIGAWERTNPAVN